MLYGTRVSWLPGPIGEQLAGRPNLRQVKRNTGEKELQHSMNPESQSHDLKRRKEEKLDGARYFIHVYTSHEMYNNEKRSNNSKMEMKLCL